MSRKIFKGIGKLAGTIGGILGPVGLVAGLAGKALSGGKKSAAAPETPNVMPTPDDEAVKRARRRSIVEQMNRDGRQSTILSEDSGLGGY